MPVSEIFLMSHGEIVIPIPIKNIHKITHNFLNAERLYLQAPYPRKRRASMRQTIKVTFIKCASSFG
jgi:hypothetical protein